MVTDLTGAAVLEDNIDTWSDAKALPVYLFLGIYGTYRNYKSWQILLATKKPEYNFSGVTEIFKSSNRSSRG